jgi:hypothetical protein
MGTRNISAQIRPQLLAEVRLLAAAEGRKLESVLDEALTQWVEKRRDEAPEIVARAARSDARRRKLYEELANWANLSRL